MAVSANRVIDADGIIEMKEGGCQKAFAFPPGAPPRREPDGRTTARRKGGV